MKKAVSNQGVPLFICVNGPGFSVVGRIVTLGLKRIAYEFMDSGEDHPHDVHVDIFSPEMGFHVRRLPCQFIAHSSCCTGGGPWTVPMRRCDLRVSAVRSDQRTTFADLVARAHLWVRGQAASKLEPIQPRRVNGCRAESGLETFIEWLTQYKSS
jgi:hypothetical protein